LYLQVSSTHKIYYEVKGSDAGRPCIFLHGGPGAGFSQSDEELFDMRKHKLVLYDQRGAGRSKPFASLKANKPHHHVSDITLLLDHLSIEQVALAGGSWGSLLALLYAIEHPERVSALVLWGVFLGTKSECDFYIRGGTQRHYPDLWQRFTAIVPDNHKDDPAPWYFDKMSDGTDREKAKYSYEWAYYETAISRLEYSEEQTVRDLEGFSYKSLAPLECFYNMNDFFLEPGHVLANLGALSDIPIYLHQGRFDFVCPPDGAYSLSQGLNNCHLQYHLAGHSHLDETLRQAIKAQLSSLV
jgi:proline iminopeptidase